MVFDGADAGACDLADKPAFSSAAEHRIEGHAGVFQSRHGNSGGVGGGDSRDAVVWA